MIEDLLKTTITSHLRSSATSRGGWTTRNCPMCVRRGHSADKRKRLGVKFSDGSIGINCFNCSFHTRWSANSLLNNDFVQFLEAIGVQEEDIKKLKFQAFKEKEAGDIFAAPVLSNRNLFSGWPRIDLPDDSLSMATWMENGCTDENFLKVCEYATSRKMTNFGDLYWTPNREYQYNKRVVIPCYHHGDIVGYSGRYYNDTFVKGLPKYINTMPADFVFNLDSQEDHYRKYCILCEGILDAYMIDGVSCIGNTINQRQIAMLKDLGKTIIVCPDRDDSGQTLVDIAVNEGWGVSLPRWGSTIKDPAAAVKKYGKLLTLKSIIDSMESNPLKIHVSRKLDNYIKE